MDEPIAVTHTLVIRPDRVHERAAATLTESPGSIARMLTATPTDADDIQRNIVEMAASDEVGSELNPLLSRLRGAIAEQVTDEYLNSDDRGWSRSYRYDVSVVVTRWQPPLPE